MCFGTLAFCFAFLVFALLLLALSRFWRSHAFGALTLKCSHTLVLKHYTLSCLCSFGAYIFMHLELRRFGTYALTGLWTQVLMHLHSQINGLTYSHFDIRDKRVVLRVLIRLFSIFNSFLLITMHILAQAWLTPSISAGRNWACPNSKTVKLPANLFELLTDCLTFQIQRIPLVEGTRLQWGQPMKEWLRTFLLQQKVIWEICQICKDEN